MDENHLYYLAESLDGIRCKITKDPSISDEAKSTQIRTIDHMLILIMEIWSAKGYGFFKELPINAFLTEAHKWYKDHYRIHTEVELEFLIDDLRSIKSTITKFGDSALFDSLDDLFTSIHEAVVIKRELLMMKRQKQQVKSSSNTGNNGCMIVLFMQIAGSISLFTSLCLFVSYICR